jgi:hypothetical protein
VNSHAEEAKSMTEIAVPVDLNTLAEGALPRVEMAPVEQDCVADLARRITQVVARRGGVIQDERHARPYMACDPNERHAMRAAVVRVLQALVLLGYIDATDAIVRP